MLNIGLFSFSLSLLSHNRERDGNFELQLSVDSIELFFPLALCKKLILKGRGTTDPPNKYVEMRSW